jgi:hypothetical protein
LQAGVKSLEKQLVSLEHLIALCTVTAHGLACRIRERTHTTINNLGLNIKYKI